MQRKVPVWVMLLGFLFVPVLVSRGADKLARKSADGMELPPAGPERKFHPVVAIGGQMLGEKPEEVGRVFNCKHSAALLVKRTTQDLGCEWYVLNAAGADVAGLGLTEGRISKVVLFYATASATKIGNIRKQLETRPDRAVKVTFTPIEADKKLSLMVAFEADAVEFYLAHHAVDTKIADALRQRTWIETMTDEQALLIGDGPGKYQALFAPDGSSSEPKSTSAIFNDNATADIRMVFDARNKEDARKQALAQHKNLKEVSKIETPPKIDPGK